MKGSENPNQDGLNNLINYIIRGMLYLREQHITYECPHIPITCPSWLKKKCPDCNADMRYVDGMKDNSDSSVYIFTCDMCDCRCGIYNNGDAYIPEGDDNAYEPYDYDDEEDNTSPSSSRLTPLSPEEGEEFLEHLKWLDVIKEIMTNREAIILDIAAGEKMIEIDRLTIPHVKKLVRKCTVDTNYENLTFFPAQFGAPTTLSLTVEDTSNLPPQKSISTLTSLLTVVLGVTNWRLYAPIEYRLGALSVTLRAYECNKVLRELLKKELSDT